MYILLMSLAGVILDAMGFDDIIQKLVIDERFKPTASVLFGDCGGK